MGFWVYGTVYEPFRPGAVRSCKYFRTGTMQGRPTISTVAKVH